jgi:uncharacterized membrane protein
MKSNARVGTHPIHPMLVSFPIAFWTASVLADLWAAWRDQFHYLGYWLAIAGCVAALVAAIPGAIDLYTAVPADSPARRTGVRHAIVNVLALVLFAASVLLRPDAGAITYASWGASLLGILLLSIGGWLGGSMVYDHRVGVPD